MVLAQDRREIAAFQELHDEERRDFHLPVRARLLVLAQVVDDGDVAVVQPGGCFALTAETGQDLGGEPVVTQMGGEHRLDRDGTAQPQIGRRPHLAHAAVPQPTVEPVAAR